MKWQGEDTMLKFALKNMGVKKVQIILIVISIIICISIHELFEGTSNHNVVFLLFYMIIVIV